MEKKQLIKKRIELLILCVGLALVYELSCLNWLKLLNHHINFSLDSNVFLCMGTFVKKGLVPYRECFDHKGPIIILINYFVSLFRYSEVGYFIVLTLFLALTIMAIYTILRLYYDKKISFLLTVACLLLIRVYGFDNLTEPYCLPFLMWSIYFACKYLKKSNIKEEHNVWYSFFYGLTFMVCVLTRITNAIPLCIFIIVGFIELAKKKKVMNIIKNIMFFIVGAVICFLPFLIYFIYKNATYDMLYGTILYNIKYTTNMEYSISAVELIKHIVGYLGVFIVSMIVAVYTAIKKQSERSVSICVALGSLVGIVFQLRSQMYIHYLIVYIPILIVAIGLVQYTLKDKKFKKIAIVLLAYCICIILFKNAMAYRDNYKLYKDNSAELFVSQAMEIKENIPEEEYGNVIAYNVEPLFYLSTDIVPCYKNFVLQDFQCSASDEMRVNFEKDIMSLKAEYIILKNGSDNDMDEFIYEHYVSIFKTESLILLRRK